MTAQLASARPCAAEAWENAIATAGRYAASVDRENRFPNEAIAALREASLLGHLVPRSAGGLGGSISEACRIANALGAQCLSTGLIWAMHSQQILIIGDHGLEQWHDVLSSVAQHGALVASATSEPGKSGLLMRARAPLQREADSILVERPSPVVSYGAEADWFLVTMRGDSSAPESDVRYVILKRGEGVVTGDWQAMGVRGTRSVPMHFSAELSPDRLLDVPFRTAAAMSAVPAAHLGWSSAWLGAARGSLERFIALLREGDSEQRRRLGSDLFMERLARVRLRLDLAEAMLGRLIERFERMRASAAPVSCYEEPEWTVAINGVKVASSEFAYEIVDSLVGLAGLRRGYLQDSELGLERNLRDLRSAALMVSNESLLQAGAREMVLKNNASGGALWQMA